MTGSSGEVVNILDAGGFDITRPWAGVAVRDDIANGNGKLVRSRYIPKLHPVRACFATPPFADGQEISTALRQRIDARIAASQALSKHLGANLVGELPADQAQPAGLLHIEEHLRPGRGVKDVQVNFPGGADLAADHIADLHGERAGDAFMEKVEVHQGRIAQRRANPLDAAGVAGLSIYCQGGKGFALRDQGHEEIAAGVGHTGKGHRQGAGKQLDKETPGLSAGLGSIFKQRSSRTTAYITAAIAAGRRSGAHAGSARA